MINLRKELAEELRIVLKDFQLKKQKSNKANDYELAPITVYEQNLPPAKFGKEKFYAPLVVVQTNGGALNETGKTVNVTLIIQTWDDADPQTGEDDVINIITRITDHFTANPRLNKKYWCENDMSFAVDNEQNPFFDGNILMTWELPAMTQLMEDDF